MELYEFTIHELKEKLQKKEVSVVDVVNSYLDRIKNYDDKIKSYITVCDDEAICKAKEIQKLYDDGNVSGLLAGIPIGIKDNICTKDVRTTCASRMLEDFVPSYDATVVKRLKDNSAIILGKMNMDEFAMGGSTENSYFFKTKNPWGLDRVPGGSSGGSAASVASDFVTVALGSDTGGSIRQPASFCSVVGLKPTYGLVSRYGLVAFASSLDQIGPIAKDVEDASIVMNVIAGHDEMDSTSVNVHKVDYSKCLVNDVKGLKIGVAREYLGEGIDPDVKNAILEAIHQYEKMGAIVEEFSLDFSEYLLPTYYIIACAEASSNLGRYDGIRYGHRAEKFESLNDLYMNSRSEGFGSEVKRRIMLGTYVLSSGYYDAYYKKAQQVRTLVRNKFNDLFGKYDILISPTSPCTAFKIGERTQDPLKMYLSDICTVSVNIAGIPAMSIPCGFDGNGLPIGLQIMAKSFREDILFRSAYAYEQSTDWHLRKAKGVIV